MAMQHVQILWARTPVYVTRDMKETASMYALVGLAGKVVAR